MGKLTENKPKCLISVNGATVLETVSIGFPDATLHIIGDYKIDVLQSYLEIVHPDFDYNLIKASGYGTIAGISEALNFIPKGEPFAISWSDLFYRSQVFISDETKNYVGLTNSNRCRFMFQDGKFIEKDTTLNGVIGLFLFRNKTILPPDLPDIGEFVRFLSRTKIVFSNLLLDSVYEIGTMDNYLSFKSQFPVSRFFNNIEIKGETVIKHSLNPKFKYLLDDEINWYKYMENVNFTGVPEVLSYEPLKLKRIIGMHPHQIKGLSHDDKLNIIEEIIKRLHEVHSVKRSPVISQDLYYMYIIKTIDRITPVVKMLKLKPNQRFIVNGKKVEAVTPDNLRNIMDQFKRLTAISFFCTIH